MEIKYKDLSFNLKVGIVGGFISIILNGIAFAWGFMQGLIGV